jgi:hypothetical protein
MLGGMKVTSSAGEAVDVGDEEILRAAGVIYSARRKTHGHPPLRSFHCRWCSATCIGMKALEAHQRECTQRPTDLVAVTDADWAALAWQGPDAA